MRKFNWQEGKNNVKVIGHGEVAQEGCPNIIEIKGKRKSCGNKNVLPTGKLFEGNRTYKCEKCNVFFASQTNWASCSNEQIIREKNGLIANDLVAGPDCWYCPIPKKEGFDVKKLAQEGKKCPYFMGMVKFDKAQEIQQ